MLYSYRCPKCGWAGDRLAKIATRDMQTCQGLVDCSGEDDRGGVGFATCHELLVREEIAQTAALPTQWGEWRYKGG